MTFRPIVLLTINLGLRIVGTLQTATTGVPYVGVLYGYRGIEPYFWSVSSKSAAMPAGLALTTDSDGNAVISGTPTVPGIYVIRIVLRDSTGLSVFRDVRIVVQ